jgi:hypothetical protein
VSLRRIVALAAIIIAALATRSAPLAAQQADVIRGRIIGPDSQPIANANVRVTSIDGNVTRSSKTDRVGRFTITFPGGDGDYMVTIGALGFAAKRFEVKRTADQDILLADAKLARADAIVLDKMTVTAPRDKVRRDDVPPDVGGSERPIDTQAGLPAASLGDLAAMAASLPGVQLVPGENGGADGFSVLGLGADQNNATLNGMQFGGANLPRDAAVVSSLVTAPYDVSRGGFSGGQMSLRTRSGSNFITRGNSLNLDSPQAQWTDRASEALGQQYSNLSLGGLVSGPIRFDKAFYNISYQLGRRASDLRTLLSTDPVGLQAAGVSADSVSRLVSILGQSRVPTSVRQLPSDRLGEQGSLLGAIDFAPPNSSSGQAFNLTFSGNWNAQRPATGFTTELPAFSGERTNWRAGVQGRHSSYFGVGILSETSVGYNASRNWGTPYLDMPAGRVRVSSLFADSTTGVQTLSFGGNPGLDTRQLTRTVDAINQLSWFSANNKHRLKLTTELREETSSLYQATNLRGTFSFNSLADLEAGRPASFSRSLAPRERDASQLVGGLSLGDSYRPTRDLQVQYGLRVDANHYLSDPTANPEVERLFGVPNDYVPNRVYASPRVGFSWTYGTASQVAGFDGAARAPRAVIRGGVGLFQNTPGTGLIGSALDNTGLPGALQQLTCIGPAAPTPDWNAYATNPSSVPSLCADGTAGTVFANSAPNVTLFSKDFSAPKSVRSNLQWNGPVLDNRFSLQVDGTYSANLNQQGFVDLNFNPVTQFSLASEGGRPVFARPSSIVPTTGSIAARDAVISSAFNRVTQQRSDLRSESRQLTLRLVPAGFSTRFNWNASYVYSNVRDRVRGFNSTVGNPLDVEWGRSSADSRHQLVYSLDYNFFDAVRVSWFGSFRSGAPFTPTVAGDVNGDGYANDRAFIFNPASAGDTALASGIQALLSQGSSAARSCLQSQLGKLAGRNSCQGPWTSSATMSITFNPLKVHMPQRASLSLQLSNPLGAADLALHGSNGLRGWGQPGFPDASLLYVRGFDPVTQRFRYEVNQRFGSTNPAFAAFRSPVTVTALMRFDLGPTRERQSLTQQLDRGRKTSGDRLPPQFLRAMYGSGGIPNPIATILRQQDSLHLTAVQADSIAGLNRWYSVRVDSIWAPVTAYFAALPNVYDQGEAYERYLIARRATVDILSRTAPTIKGILTAEQLRKLPSFITSYLDPRYLASIRSGTVAFTSSAMPGGGGPGGGTFTAVAGGGGGVQQIIIR